MTTNPMTDDYSKREIDRMFLEIQEALGRIEKQTVKTNGRVGNLENWRYLITGGLIIISAIVIPMGIFIFQNQTGIASNTASVARSLEAK